MTDLRPGDVVETRAGRVVVTEVVQRDDDPNTAAGAHGGFWRWRYAGCTDGATQAARMYDRRTGEQHADVTVVGTAPGYGGQR